MALRLESFMGMCTTEKAIMRKTSKSLAWFLIQGVIRFKKNKKEDFCAS